MNKYPCEIPDCDNKVPIRSKIKNRDSEYFGKLVCPICADKYNAKKRKNYKIKKRTEKTTEKRAEERKEYPEFFRKHIENIKDNNICCQECGDRLRGDVSEIAHLLAKRNNPEVAVNDMNIIYLCGMHSENQCHSLFDSNFKNRENMKVFPLAVEKYKLFKDQIINITNEALHYENNLK